LLVTREHTLTFPQLSPTLEQGVPVYLHVPVVGQFAVAWQVPPVIRHVPVCAGQSLSLSQTVPPTVQLPGSWAQSLFVEQMVALSFEQ
jgi:hypothetical protein